MLSSPVLVLNRNYMPVNTVTVRRAFCMLLAGIAKAIDNNYCTFDFKSWSELSASVHDETIGLVGKMVRVPRVILLATYDRFPSRCVRLSRINIMLRDNHKCQYCGKTLKRSQLSLDHVIPRSRGGTTTWENVITSCFTCNRKKGGNTPEEAGMKLLSKPQRPRWTPLGSFLSGRIYEEWKDFISVVDFSYWHVELDRE